MWVTNVTGSPVYTPCATRRTKIDPETGHCKKKGAAGCPSKPAEPTVAVLDFSDPTGMVEKVLVDEKVLCVLAKAKSKDDSR